MVTTGLHSWIDILSLSCYFVVVFVLGLWSVCKKEKGTIKGYFLAGRTMTWFPIGASLFASNIGSEHFIGLAGTGAASGIAVVAFEWGAVLLLLLLGWVFLPVYIKAGVFTIPEFLSLRFGGQRLRIYLSVMALCFAVLTKISVDIFAGAVFIQQALGWNIYVSIAILLSITAVYTVAGGLATVIITDTLHTVMMLLGSLALAVLAFIKVGGIGALTAKYMDAIPQSHYSDGNASANVHLYLDVNSTMTSNVTESKCGYPPADAFHIFRDPVTSSLPWPGVLIRSTLVSVWYWCTDQVIVQRTLAAKNMAHARAGTILAGYLKILPLFLIIYPGMISRVLFPETVACSDPETCMEVCDNPVGCSNVAYPQLVLGLAPVGMRGVMIAVIVAAVMSSLTSIFNSSATIFTLDIWRKFRPLANDGELLVVGRIFVVIIVLVSVGWVPLIKEAEQGQLFMYIQAINGYMAPPVCALFLLAIFVPRVNEKGAFVGLLVGQSTGIVRMILDFVYPAPRCGQPDTRPGFISKFHFTYFSAVLLLVTALIMLVFSFLTKDHQTSQMKSLTFWYSAKRKHSISRTPNDVENSNELKETMTDIMRDGSNSKMTDTANGKTEINGEMINGVVTEQENNYAVMLQNLHISTKMNWFLNINAILVICVFIVLYGIFH